jgi:hypothetical protein
MSQRRSYISALRQVAPQKEGPLHVGWQRLRAALRGARVAPGLWKRSLHAKLGPHARVKPTPHAIVELLDGYLRTEARGRVEEGRFVIHRDGDRDSARRIVARLHAALPELGVLTLADERREGRQTLLLRTVGAHVEVSPVSILEEPLDPSGQWVQRTVTVDALVEAANRLLALRQMPIRFLPIDGPDDVAAYLAVDVRSASLLDEIDFWIAPVEDLAGFAGWPGEVEATRVA